MRSLLRLSLFVLVSSAIGSSSSFAEPVVFTVNTTVDSLDSNPGDGTCADTAGLCSLRAAIMEANANASVGDDIIDLPAGVYTLTRGSLVITDGVIIRGAGSIDTIIDGDHRSGVLEVGNVLYDQTLDQGTANGALVPRAIVYGSFRGIEKTWNIL
jgi:CSLREA domain-containing protein